MTPAIRKAVLALHLVASVGWIGAVAAYLALGVAAVSSEDAQMVRAAWMAMELTGWFVIVPFAGTALVTGILMALGTPWGLFRHYWVLISLLLTILSTVVLLLHMPTVSSLADGPRGTGTVGHGPGGDLLHPGVGFVVLVVIMVLNVYKPRGLTPYGQRVQQQERRKRQ